MRVRVKLLWDGSSWRVDLPTAQMVPGSLLPVIPGRTTPHGVLAVDQVTGAPLPMDHPALSGLTVAVEVPDDYTDTPGGPIKAALLRKKYAGHPRFGRDDYTPDI
jgi:hypothetical protein